MDWSQTPKAPLIIDDQTLEYACFGPAPDTAPTIVLLHEGLGGLALWRDFPQALAKATGWGVFAYSRLGYGQSDPAPLPRPTEFMTIEATTVLPQVLDQIGFRRGILFGHSDGATIAAISAGSIEDHRIRGLILMAPHFFTEPMGVAAIRKAREAFETGDLKTRMSLYHRDPVNAFRGWADTWLSPAFENWNVAEVIDYLRVPVLAIQGRDDQYGTLAQIEEIATRAYCPVDTLIIEDCKHAPHQEKPQVVMDAVSEFVMRLERIEAAQVETA